MTLNAPQIADIARRLDTAQRDGTITPGLAGDYPEMSWDDAYAAQAALCELKLARGAAVVGMKLGLTSKAKLAELGMEQPICGVLMDTGQVANGGVVETAGLVSPKVEGEVVFRLKSALGGADVDVAAVMAATEMLLPAIEIVASRYGPGGADFKSIVADNCAAACFVLGEPGAVVDAADLPGLRVTLARNGVVEAQASGADVFGNPAAAIAELARMMHRRGGVIPAGSVILSGAATAQVAVSAGDVVEVRWDRLGAASVRFA